jgi:hypothetical protein
VTAVASAQSPTPPGAAALSSARAAWTRHDFAAAATQYQAALDAGGLAPADVVDAYLHLGVSLTVVKKYNPALAAFREAAALDPHFTVPRGSGPLAVAMAERARKEKEKAKLGPIALTADVPSDVAAGAPFGVTASLDAAHLSMPASIAIAVKDPLSGAHFEDTKEPAPDVRFTVPTRMTLPGASLSVQIDALDAHANRLATVEQHVRVGAAVVASHGHASPAHGPSTSSSSSSSSSPSDEPDHVTTSSGGFWHTAWPYVIGGVALAAGGAAAYFLTRPPDDVNIDAARVQVR